MENSPSPYKRISICGSTVFAKTWIVKYTSDSYSLYQNKEFQEKFIIIK